LGITALVRRQIVSVFHVIRGTKEMGHILLIERRLNWETGSAGTASRQALSLLDAILHYLHSLACPDIIIVSLFVLNWSESPIQNLPPRSTATVWMAHHLSLSQSTPVVRFAPTALLSLFLLNISGQFPATHGGQKPSFKHPEYAPPAL